MRHRGRAFRSRGATTAEVIDSGEKAPVRRFCAAGTTLI